MPNRRGAARVRAKRRPHGFCRVKAQRGWLIPLREERPRSVLGKLQKTHKKRLDNPPAGDILAQTNQFGTPACSGALLNAEQERGGARPRKAPPAWILPGEGPTRLNP